MPFRRRGSEALPTISLLDGNTVTALAQRNPVTHQKIRELQPGDEVITCFVVVAEWEYGILNADGRKKQQAIRAQGELVLSEMSRIIESSLEINLAYGEISAELRRAGTMIPQNDVWIAAVARTLGRRSFPKTNIFSASPIFLETIGQSFDLPGIIYTAGRFRAIAGTSSLPPPIGEDISQFSPMV